MNNQQTEGFTLKVETPESSASHSFPCIDVDIDEVCNAFFSLMIGVTFMPTTILEGMRNFAQQHLEALKED